MKNAFRLLVCGLFVLCTALPLWAMPPHPDLAARIQNLSTPEPYYIQHFDELHARGVDAPFDGLTLERLRRHSLDDNLNILVLMVDFSDHGSQVQPWRFDTLLFGQGNHTLNDFYHQISYGNLNLVTVNLPSALGWREAPQTYAYYVDGQNGMGSYPHNSQRLTEDAVHMVDSLVDFSQYDNDGDGHVDALFILHSGRGAEYTGNDNDIWSHAWVTHTPQQVDGVIVDHYSTEPEYWQMLNDMTCGVYAHEMGHAVFGLPDLYDVTYASEGVGTWSLMAGGSWNGNNGNSPANPDAWTRIRMGFAEATVLTNNLVGAIIPQVETSPVIYRLWADGAQGNEYYLVENRQEYGYDTGLPRGGLLIYHIDDAVNNNTNPWYPGHTGGHYWVAVEQADGRYDLEHNSNGGDASDPYSDQNSTSFTNSTEPNSRAYSGSMTRVTVRNISALSDTMTADLAVRAGAGNLVFLDLPDTVVTAADTLDIPVMVDDLTGQNVTSVHLTIACDSAVALALDPYYVLSGTLIPQNWSVTQSHSSGVIAFDASGAAPLSGQGVLIKLRFFIRSDAGSDMESPIVFRRLLFNQGTPAADIPTGSITVSVSHILLQPSDISFGTVQLGTSPGRTILVRNQGSAPLTVSAVTISTPYSTNFAGQMTVQPGAWSPLQLTFSPTSAGEFRDTLVVASNAIEGTVRVPVSGTGAVLAADYRPTALPVNFALTQVYPNPFNPSTAIGYDVPRSSRLTIQVFDVLGRLIDTPVHGTVEPGHHTLTWSCPSCGSGIYLFVMSAEGSRYTQKAMLLR